MDERFGYCTDCLNKDMCRKCYRGSYYEKKEEKEMKKFILPIVLMLICCIVPSICIIKRIQFKQECSGYLKQVADANTPEIALSRLGKALEYVERNNLNDGYTSIVWKTEDENVGFWYENLIASKSELERCINSSQLEKTNVLMKVRESLTDNGEKGTILTIPPGIHKFPDNTLWAILLWVSLILMALDILYTVYINGWYD